MKNLIISITTFVLIGIITTYSSCANEEVSAKESLPGFWKVISIKSFYAQFSINGGNSGPNVISQEGDLGNFQFSENGVVSYMFLRNDTTYQDTTKWILQSRTERSSGFKVTKYSLDISSDLKFEVLFGNGAKNFTKECPPTRIYSMA